MLGLYFELQDFLKRLKTSYEITIMKDLVVVTVYSKSSKFVDKLARFMSDRGFGVAEIRQHIDRENPEKSFIQITFKSMVMREIEHVLEE